MVGLRKFRWIIYGGGFVWIVVEAVIFLKSLSVSYPVVDISMRTVHVGGCQSLANQTLQMISTSNKTTVKTPWPDTETTTQLCADVTYGRIEDLPRASVIITFHDTETIFSLLHTIHSVIQRTPCSLLQDIIVIDDFSKKEDFGELLDIYTRRVFSNKVKLFRNSENIGLIRSRLKGARLSEGEVIIFMDSHSEVQPGWLEPLLYEIKKNRKTLANSFIDLMEKSSTTGVWNYERTGLNWIVLFDWSMEFGWQEPPKQYKERKSATDPIKTKVIIGTYAAIDRRFFEEIGAFDEGMQIWGGENIDLSIRAWLFGGQVLYVPCSRAAHLEGNHTRDYRFNLTSLIDRNYKRLVEVWFDEYKPYFYQYFPTLINVDPGNLEERLEVRTRALHNFSWFLQNVFPELGVPDRDSFAWGRLKNEQSLFCLMHYGSIEMNECNSASGGQLFYWSQKFELRQPTRLFQSLDVTESGVTRKVLTGFDYIPFYNNDLGAKWIHWKNGPLLEQVSGLCLTVAPNLRTIEMAPCDYEKNRYQVWAFEHYTDEYFER